MISPETKAIDAELKDDKKRAQSELKLLLLGAGESGKSTIAKQMKIIHLQGFDNEEIEQFKPIIRSNCIECIKVLVQAAQDMDAQLAPDNAPLGEKFASANAIDMVLNATTAAEIAKLWKDPAVQRAYENRSKFQLPDSASHVLENVARIAQPNYVPSPDDILRCRARTTGIHEILFRVQNFHFRMVDVGGQRSERKKWVHCLSDRMQILTNRGFLFYNDVVQQCNDASFRVAQYNPDMCTLEYVPLTKDELVFREEEPQALVSFSHKSFDNKMDVSLMVTEDHTMYAARNDSMNMERVPASRVESEWNSLRFLSRCQNGLGGNLVVDRSFFDRLGVQTLAQESSVCFLYGLFLRDGSVVRDGAICFEQHSVVLENLMSAGLQMGSDVLMSAGGGEIVVVNAIWVNAFSSMSSAKSIGAWAFSQPSVNVRSMVAGLTFASPSSSCIHTSSVVLRDQLVQLLLHAGFSATFCANGSGWNVLFEDNNVCPEMSVSRNVQRVAYNSYTWCVSVPSHLIVTRHAEAQNGVVNKASVPVIVGNCFQDVTAILFVVAMNSYDMRLYEDENVNRMHEAIQLFDEICNSKWFRTTALVLFLNKSDLFKEKIEKTDLKVCFADYSGGCNFANASNYLQAKFKSLNRQPNKPIYMHLTCATDTENVKFVFNSVRDVLLNVSLGASGF